MQMNVGMKRAAVATSVALSMAVGGFALGRVAQPGSALAAAPAPEVAQAPPALQPPGQDRPASFAPVVASAAPAVVHIKVVSVVNAAEEGEMPPELFGDGGRSPFPMPPRDRGQTRRGQGSGFIIRKDGVVLTNNHVVEGAKEITVTLADGREFPARVMGRDPKTDLAVVKIEPKGTIPVAELGSSEALRVGDWVVAIGNPFGLSNTVTAGIVSAKGRSIGSGPYDQFIQTDASINPGNSGGPLLNEQGQVVGINSAIYSQTGGSVGIGFAIPIDLAKRLVPELEETGHVTRAWLGVTVQKLTPDLAQSLGAPSTIGALVSSVDPHGPAAKAGLERGDIITSYDGKVLKEEASLPGLVASTAIGKSVDVAVLRGGKEKSFAVAVTKLADEATAEEAPADKGKWGLALRDLTPPERQQRGLESGEGVLVAGIAPDSPAAEGNIQPGDVVLQVNHEAVGSIAALRAAAAKIPDGKPLLLLVRPQDGPEHFTTLAAR
jgi:serine protease Do